MTHMLLKSSNDHLRQRAIKAEKELSLLKQLNGFDALESSYLNKIEALKVNCEHWHESCKDALKQLKEERDVNRKKFGALNKENFELRKSNNSLNEQIEILHQKISEQSEIIAELNSLILKLKAQINRDYTNSSIPSSQKINKKKICNSREKSGLRPGGQPGHKGSRLKLSAKPDKIIDIPAPEHVLNDPAFIPTGKVIRKQLIKLVVGSYVEEYCATEYKNVNTGELVHGSFPEGMVNEVTYDKSVKAFASTLNNYCNVSVNKVRDFLKDISNGQICISTGKVSNLTKELSDKTTKERENIYNDLLNSPFMNADFTTLRVNGKNLSTLIATTGNGALFDYTRTKGIDSLNNSIVAHYLHTLIHDHDVSFYHYGGSHQECLAHILRYLEDSKVNEPHLTWNDLMKKHLQTIIHDKKSGNLNDKVLNLHRYEYFRILRLADDEYKAHPPNKKYYPDGANLAKRLRKYAEDVLYFMYHQDIPHTNNAAERMARQVKRKARAIGCFRSDAGACNYLNLLSIIETARIKNKSVYQTISQYF